MSLGNRQQPAFLERQEIMRATHLLRNAALKMSFVLLLWLAAMPLLRAHRQEASQPTGDAVADAARKTREEKKTAAKPKKIFTDDDISPRPASNEAQHATPETAPTDAAQKPAAQSAEGVAAAKAGDEQESVEAKWRKRFKAAREKLAAAEKQLDVMQRDLNKSELQYYPDPQKAMKEQNTREAINERTAKIDAQKAEIAKLKQGLSDLEDDLRKSGGDTGWARE
jgi:hypothetical protein